MDLFPKCTENTTECSQFNELMLRWELSAAMREQESMGFWECVTHPGDCAVEKYTDAYKTAGATVGFTVDHIYRGLKLRGERTAACFIERNIAAMQPGEVLTPEGMQKLLEIPQLGWNIKFWENPQFMSAATCIGETVQAEKQVRTAGMIEAVSLAQGLNYFSGTPQEKGLVNSLILTLAFGLYPMAQSPEERVSAAFAQNIRAVPQANNLCDKPEFPRAKNEAEVKQYRNLFNSYAEKFVARWNKENGENKKVPRWIQDDGNRFPDEHEVENYDTQLVCDILEAIETNRQILLAAQLEQYQMVATDTEENLEGLTYVEQNWVRNQASKIAKHYHRLFAWGSGINFENLSWADQHLDENSKMMFQLGLRGESFLPAQADTKALFHTKGGDKDFLAALENNKILRVQYLPWIENGVSNPYVRLRSPAPLPNHTHLRLPFHIVEELDPRDEDYQNAMNSETGLIISNETPPQYLVFTEDRAFRVTNIAAHPETQHYIVDIANAIDESSEETGLDEDLVEFLRGSAEMLRRGDFANLSGYGIIYEELKQQKAEGSRLVIQFVNQLLFNPNLSFTVSRREDGNLFRDQAVILEELRQEVKTIAQENGVTLVQGEHTVVSLVSNILSSGLFGALSAYPMTLAGVSHPEALPGTTLRMAEIRQEELTLNLDIYTIPYRKIFGHEPVNFVETFFKGVNLHESSHAFDPGKDTIVGSEQEKTLGEALRVAGHDYQSAYIEALAMAAEFRICETTEDIEVILRKFFGKLPPAPQLNVANGHATAVQALLGQFFTNGSLKIEGKHLRVVNPEKLKATAQLFRTRLLETTLTRELSAREIGLATSLLLTSSISNIPEKLYAMHTEAKKGIPKVTGYTSALLE